MSGEFGHLGPLKPVDVPQAQWAAHPLLRMAHLGPRGVVWHLETSDGQIAARQRHSLDEIRFTPGSGRNDGVAHLPPRLNHDWFVTSETDEDAPAPILGRAPDVTRFYERDTLLSTDTVVGAETIDEVRRYFEWRHAVWVQVPLSRWLTIRSDGWLRGELSDAEMRQRHPEAHAAPRTADSTDAAQWTEVEALIEARRAEAIAVIAHSQHTDQVGEPTINHAARVAGRFDPLTHPIEHAAGWLHDVLENSDISARDMLDAGVHPSVVKVVAVITRHGFPEEDQDFYERLRGNPRALRVKTASLDDDAATWRTRQLTGPAQARLAEKHRALRLALGLSAELSP